MKSTYVKLAFATVAFLLFTAGCTSFPAPGKKESSMCIVLVDTEAHEDDQGASDSVRKKPPSMDIDFTGPTSFTVHARTGTKQHARYIKVEPGDYRYPNPGDGSVRTFEIPPDTVYLLQEKINYGFTLAPLTPQDMRWVSDDIVQFINYYDWYGKSFAGFGPYVPRFTLDKVRYDLAVSSDPKGARVLIDEREWGRTPITVQLESGKHLLRLEQEGFSPVQTYVQIEGDSEYTVSLEKRSAGEATPGGAGESGAESGFETPGGKSESQRKESVYSMLVLPFHNTGSEEYDHIGGLFADGIETGLFNRENVTLLHPSARVTKEALRMPAAEALRAAEKYGAELLVTGTYYVSGNSVSVDATLFDVRTSQVKTSSLSAGEAGLAMFDTIDEINGEFLDNLDKALPAVGKEIVEQQQVVTQELISYQREASVSEINRKRHSRKNSFAVLPGWGAMLYEPHNNVDTYDHLRSPNQGKEGPIFWGMAQYERDLTQRFSITNRLILPFTGRYSDGLGAHLYTGPQLSFPGKGSAFFIGALGHLVYNPPASYEGELQEGEDGEGGVVEVEKGSIVSFGLSLDAHLKVYLNKRLDTIPRFIQFGLTWDELTGAYEFDTQNINRYILGMMLYFGFGVRL